MPEDQKSREAVMAEREAKKKEKAARRKTKKQQEPPEGQKGQTGQKDAQDTKQSEVAKFAENQPPKKTNAQLKAERRAKQEAQRAAKAAAKAEPAEELQKDQTQPVQAVKANKGHRVPDDMQADRASVEKKLQKKLASAQLPARTKAQRKVALFGHLHQYERELSIGLNLPVVGGTVHPALITLGLKLAEGTISGSNARCVALLVAMKKVIGDYVTPPQKELSRDLDSRLKPYITFLKQCRPPSVSMGNAIRFLKTTINSLDPKLPDGEAKQFLVSSIDKFVHENIILAAQQISITANAKIRDGDVILTYGCSSLLRAVFEEAHNSKRFRVIVADGRPRMEGREMVRNLINAGIQCSYTLVSAVPYFMPEVTKVLLGAHAVFANGSVMSRVGSSQVALMAKASNVPVLVCCETYKFSERVQTDSFVFNELGDPDDLVSTGKSSHMPLADWRDLSSLCLLNLAYDVTPASLVDAIISEISMIPTTSVPVVLRLKSADQQPA